jgi:hypothetical protein
LTNDEPPAVRETGPVLVIVVEEDVVELVDLVLLVVEVVVCAAGVRA